MSILRQGVAVHCLPRLFRLSRVYLGLRAPVPTPRALSALFPLPKNILQAQVTGLDLSPYMLAVADLRERQGGGGMGRRSRITYLHRSFEASGLPEASFDLVSVQFVTHELPADAIERLVSRSGRGVRCGAVLLHSCLQGHQVQHACLHLCKLSTSLLTASTLTITALVCQVGECRRLLRPGGTLLLADNNPRSKVIQSLPPVLFTLASFLIFWGEGRVSTGGAAIAVAVRQRRDGTACQPLAA